MEVNREPRVRWKWKKIAEPLFKGLTHYILPPRPEPAGFEPTYHLEGECGQVMVLDSVDTIPAGTPVFRISRDEDPSARAKTRKLVLKESRMAFCRMHQMQEQRFTDVDRELHELRQKHSRELNAQRQRAIDRELAEVDHQLTRLNRKYSRLKEVLQYEVLNRLTKVVDEEAREQFLTSDEVETLKSANFNWFGYFVDLDSKFSGVGPDVRAIATKVLNGVGEVAVTQFLLCRNLMSRAGEQGRHEQQHPLPSVEHAKTIISTTAATSPGLDVEWIHAMIDRCDAFASEGKWDEREDLEEDIEYLQAKKAGLERELELEPPLPT